MGQLALNFKLVQNILFRFRSLRSLFKSFSWIILFSFLQQCGGLLLLLSFLLRYNLLFCLAFIDNSVVGGCLRVCWNLFTCFLQCLFNKFFEVILWGLWLYNLVFTMIFFRWKCSCGRAGLPLLHRRRKHFWWVLHWLTVLYLIFLYLFYEIFPCVFL